MTIKAFLSDIDFFGGTIGFTFKGKKSHTTMLGGVCSMISVFILIMYYTIKSVDFFGRLDPSISMVENFQDSSKSIDLTALGYRFAIERFDESLGEYQLFQFRRERQENGTISKTYSKLDLVPCD